MRRTVLVVGDIRQGKLRRVTAEMVAAGLDMADGGTVQLAVVGHGLDPLLTNAVGLGVQEVLAVDHPALVHYVPSAYRAAVLACVQVARPDLILLAHSAVGRDLAPLVAARLGAGQVSDIVGWEPSGDGLWFVRPIYAGKAFTKVEFLAGPMVVTVRPNNLPSKGGPSPAAPVRRLDVAFPPADLATMVQQVVTKTGGGVDLSEAKIIVSGGRGVKSAAGFGPLRELAQVLGAAVGASRGACDAGYCDYALQIGQTGKVVTPDLYIACGISGAIQHLAGMSNAKVIVAINKDPEAPIFQVADYGIVGDLFEVVPLLTEEFRRRLA